MFRKRKPRRGWWYVEMENGETTQVFARYASEALHIASLGNVKPLRFMIPQRAKEKILV